MSSPIAASATLTFPSTVSAGYIGIDGIGFFFGSSTTGENAAAALAAQINAKGGLASEPSVDFPYGGGQFEVTGTALFCILNATPIDGGATVTTYVTISNGTQAQRAQSIVDFLDGEGLSDYGATAADEWVLLQNTDYIFSVSTFTLYALESAAQQANIRFTAQATDKTVLVTYGVAGDLGNLVETRSFITGATWDTSTLTGGENALAEFTFKVYWTGTTFPETKEGDLWKIWLKTENFHEDVNRYRLASYVKEHISSEYTVCGKSSVHEFKFSSTDIPDGRRVITSCDVLDIELYTEEDRLRDQIEQAETGSSAPAGTLLYNGNPIIFS